MASSRTPSGLRSAGSIASSTRSRGWLRYGEQVHARVGVCRNYVTRQWLHCIFFDQEKKYCLSSSSWSSSWSSSTCSFRCGGADRNMIGFPVFFFTGSIARFRDSATFFSCVTRTVV